MKIFRIFGFGGRQIIACGQWIPGRITDVKECLWMKINTKPIRAHAWDGAVYPHMVSFEYAVDGHSFIGRRYWPWTLSVPAKGTCIRVFYDPRDPARWAIEPDNAIIREKDS